LDANHQKAFAIANRQGPAKATWIGGYEQDVVLGTARGRLAYEVPTLARE